LASPGPEEATRKPGTQFWVVFKESVSNCPFAGLTWLLSIPRISIMGYFRVAPAALDFPSLVLIQTRWPCWLRF
jgi:hypothetical protein